MTIIEITQGYYGDLTGTPKTEALAMFIQHDNEFLERNPQCKPYHRPAWREFEAPDNKKAPWGHEWYVVEDGVLRMHSAHYDSSG